MRKIWLHPPWIFRFEKDRKKAHHLGNTQEQRKACCHSRKHSPSSRWMDVLCFPNIKFIQVKYLLTKILLSVIVCSTWFLRIISSFLSTFIAYLYFVSLFLTSITFPYDPLPMTDIISKSFLLTSPPVFDCSCWTICSYYSVSVVLAPWSISMLFSRN